MTSITSPNTLRYYSILVCSVTQSCPTLATPWTAAHQALRPWDFPGKSTGVGYLPTNHYTVGPDELPRHFALIAQVYEALF